MTTHHTPSKLEAFMAIFGAALGFSVLFMFALSSFVNMLYDTGSGHTSAAMHAADEQKHDTPDGQQAAKNTTAEHGATDAATTPVETVSIGKLLAQGDAKKGAKVAKKCLACHGFDKGGKNKVGPNLYEIVGRKIAENKGFKYSTAMKKYAKAFASWKYENLVAYLRKPKKVVPKTKMAFAGIKKDKDLANLIAFLRSNAETPVPLPAN
jgi:cytochrome c